MVIPEVITLQSRYADVVNKLVKVEDNLYKLDSTVSNIRVIESIEHSESFDAIDPCGGPILGVGDCLGDNGELIINKIYHSKKHGGFVLEVIENKR